MHHNANVLENLSIMWKSLKLFNTRTGQEALRTCPALQQSVALKYKEVLFRYPQYHYIFLDFYHLFYISVPTANPEDNNATAPPSQQSLSE